jgi:THO complex subunit 3
MSKVESKLTHLQSLFKSATTKTFQAHNSKIHSIAWNSDGRRLASGSNDKTVAIFTLENKEKLSKESTFKGHTDPVDQLCWHPDNNDLLATASGDKTVRIYDCRSSKAVKSIETPGENINICWSPDGRHVAVGNKDDLISFIDTRTFKLSSEKQFKFEVNEISWNRDGDLFFITTGLGTIVMLSWPQLNEVHTIEAHLANCICLEFDRSGRYFATGSADALVSLWDVKSLVCLRTFGRLEWPVRTLSFNCDSQLLASASEDHFIDVAFVETSEQVASIKCDTSTFTIAWHPKHNILAYACDDNTNTADRDIGTVKLWIGANSD